MRLDFLRPLYERSGPYASVYMDVSRRTEEAQTGVELRWRELRERLAPQVPPALLDALERHLTDRNEVAPGRAVFATDTLSGATSGAAPDNPIALSEVLTGPPRRPIARWSYLPHTMPMLAQRGETVPHLEVLADHAGGQVTVVGAGRHRVLEVRNEEYPIQKTGQGGWSQANYERLAKETWRHSAEAVAEVVDQEIKKVNAALIVVSAEPHSLSMLMNELSAEAAAKVVTVDHGSRAPGAELDTYRREVDEALRAYLVRRREEVLDAYRRGPRAYGLADTVRALREGRVAALLLVDHPEADGRLWVGPDGNQLAVEARELRDWGVTDPVAERADAALVRAAATTDAELWFVERGELDTPDDIVARLRY